MRLDYFLAHSAGLTRKQAKQCLRRGDVAVAGEPRPKANLQLHSGQAVWLDGQPLALPSHRYLMLNKPVGVVTSTADPGHRTVLDLLPKAQRSGLHPAGRLDVDTTGLVLLTTDGQWSHRVTSPNYHCPKRYRVTCAEPVSDADLEALSAGVLLRGETRPTAPAQAQRLGERRLLLTLAEGRYHQVKRMLAARQNRVVALHREQIGTLTLDENLAEGQSRALTEMEIASI